MSGLARRLADLSSNTDLNYGLKIDGNKKKKYVPACCCAFSDFSGNTSDSCFLVGFMLARLLPIYEMGQLSTRFTML